MSRSVGRDDQRCQLCQSAVYVACKYRRLKSETLSFNARKLFGVCRLCQEMR